MATRFQSIELRNPRLFGVKLTGTVSPGDKRPLNDLADRCLEKEKIHVILDFSGVKTMGGGGASILARFQEKLTDVGGEAVFVGAGEIVRNFLEQKFEELPLRHFATADEAVEALTAVAPAPAAAPTGSDPDVDPGPADDDTREIGAVGFFEEEDDQEEADEEPADESAADRNAGGRRKDHRYTSLAEAVKALGSISESEGEKEFSDALGNLLFSQGLAEEVTLMVKQERMLASHDGAASLKAGGSLALQFLHVDRPLTLLDIQDDELDEDEVTLLADLNPDMILPVVLDGELAAVIMLKRGGEDREYTVAENFAFELLITVLAGAGENGDGPDTFELQAATVNCQQSLADEEDAHGLSMPKDQHVTEVLLKLVMDLPKADDEHHFWRIFARHAWSVFHLGEMAFLPSDRMRPQAILNQKNFRMGLDLDNDRLQLFFRSIERPIEVKNFPNFFKEFKGRMEDSGITWVVSLKWDGEYLGAILMDGVPDPGDGSVINQLDDLFAHTARMFAQFGERKDSADDSLAVVRILTAQREKRQQGSDDMTSSIVHQVDLLAKEMGFPPDQKRNLLYGCLLRDIGLIDKPDQMPDREQDMTPEQRAEYVRHPEEGVALLSGLKLPSSILDVVRCHHERFNGEGFPAGISGRKIPLAARVVTLVESYVKLITGSGGKRPLSPKDAGRIILQNKDGKFDPDLAVVFLSAVSSQSESPAESEDTLAPV